MRITIFSRNHLDPKDPSMLLAKFLIGSEILILGFSLNDIDEYIEKAGKKFTIHLAYSATAKEIKFVMAAANNCTFPHQDDRGNLLQNVKIEISKPLYYAIESKSHLASNAIPNYNYYIENYLYYLSLKLNENNILFILPSLNVIPLNEQIETITRYLFSLKKF